MKKHFSLYLDVVRFAAAVLVVLDHYAWRHVVGSSAARFIPEMGREAVVIFFVLSGFVIAYTTEVKKQTVRDYVIARAARIYSVALPLLLAAFAAVYLSEHFSGKAIAGDYPLAKAYFYLPFHSLFLGELWTLSEKPLWLESYWSLGYEVWYYVFFAALFFTRGRKKLFLGALVFLVLGYKLWLLLPIWYSGVLLWRLHGKYSVDKNLARCGWLLSMGALCAYKYFGCDQYLRTLGNDIWPFPRLPLGSADRYLADYVLCAIVLINFYLAEYAQFVFLEKFSALIRNVSSYTFTLYLAHVLVMSAWLYNVAYDNSNASDLMSLTLALILLTVLAGLVTEHRKAWFGRVFARLYDGCGHVMAMAASPFGTQK